MSANKKIGILYGRERSFPMALIEAVNKRNIPGIIAEPVRIEKVVQGEDSGYAVIIDRISQDVPFYRAYLKNAALCGAAVINNPFWWSADEKFFNNCLATRIGVPVPKTVILPSRELPTDTSDQSFTNLAFPLDWPGIFEYVGFPAYMKPFAGGGWYNKSISPADRAWRHTAYDRLILEEILPRAMYETGHGRIAVAGCSFGGYHAANFAFRHPGLVGYCFSMSGVFDIRSFTDGYYDDNIYFNNPVDFIPGASDSALWHMGIVLGTAEHDSCRGQNEWMSRLLAAKSIPHWLDMRTGRDHDWPVWKEMFPHYVSLLPNTK